MSATDSDRESIIGEECHIISGERDGPRFRTDFSAEGIDSYGNLILLCRTHHKMVDDQVSEFSPDALYKMKADHEKWATYSLSRKSELPPLRIKRVKGKSPEFLIRIVGGKQLLNLVEGADSSQCDHDELESPNEVDVVGELLQIVKDYADLSSDLEPSKKVSISFETSNTIKRLEESGFLVFGAIEYLQMEGGNLQTSKSWANVIIRIVRKTNPEILSIEEKDK